ncbi:ABC transporter ATP-binding protein [Leptospira wolffii]|uniref:ABC transporter ATP-binding protein n=1 Tax=Leptospira wolffii TaxID=409998 RepID=UPI0003540709|nr:ABC transporter ATP-binding protein [Leptospira wolffii]EPG67042.1 ABC transporter, ATP-binding protein [Leptospira wolffii serovar Khorat str. Khorat-H2]TGL54687.1 ABC transporter ATP-binding protein [Leptospira wolffii]
MISVENLEVRFGNTKVLDNISFVARPEEIVSVIGPNGSGKSTLLKSILGLVKPSGGGVRWNDQDEGLSRELDVGYMPQTPFFPKNLTVSELISFFRKLEEFEEETYHNLYETLGLKAEEGKKFGSLSGGTKQKLNILQCFSVKKPVYLVDEPTASLDPYVSHILKEILKKKKKDGALLLFSTHILSEVEEISDRFLLLAEGSLLIDDSPRNFVKKGGFENLQTSLMEFWNREYEEGK